MLQYSIMDECLYGTIGKTSFSMKAYSGGGRGSTAGMERQDLKHWNTNKKAPATFDEASRGGPLPIGFYIVSYLGRYKHFGECARIDQTIASLLQRDLDSPIGIKVTDRDGFLIHGAGPKGSDGCIVPASKSALRNLLAAIKAQKAPIGLLVHSEGVNADKLEAMKGWQNAA